MSTTLRLLLVEDSDVDAELVVYELRKGGYEPDFHRVDTAADMKAALDGQDWDLVLTDFSMPNFSAIGALTVLQNSGLDLPFIIVSGTIGEDTAVAAMKAGAHDFIMKDNLARLVPTVERELREAQVRQARHHAEAEERRLSQELEERHQQLEERVMELSALNSVLQQHLKQRSQLLKAYQNAHEGLERLATEAAALVEQTGMEHLPEIDGSGGLDPDGTVTLLFSDLEGSTVMTQRLGDRRMQEVLGAHNSIVRRQVAAYDGFEVKSLGDGFMLAFSSARKALDCAVNIQQVFCSYNEDHPDEPLLVRMGLHTGEAMKEDEDFFGKSVILASRITDQAHGGQILVSSLLKELTESAGDLTFGEEREVALKGLPGHHRVYLLNWQ